MIEPEDERDDDGLTEGQRKRIESEIESIKANSWATIFQKIADGVGMTRLEVLLLSIYFIRANALDEQKKHIKETQEARAVSLDLVRRTVPIMERAEKEIAEEDEGWKGGEK